MMPTFTAFAGAAFLPPLTLRLRRSWPPLLFPAIAVIPSESVFVSPAGRSERGLVGVGTGRVPHVARLGRPGGRPRLFGDGALRTATASACTGRRTGDLGGRV